MTMLSMAAAASAQPFDVATATQYYLDSLRGAARARSDSYFVGGYWLILWGALISAGVNLLILQTRWSAKWAAWAGRTTRHRPLQVMLYAVPFVLVSTLISLPWTIYSEFVREKQYGLMNQNFAAWSAEQLVGLAVSLVLSAVVLAAFMAVIRWAPRLWWLIGTGVAVVFLFLGLAIAPVFIAPLFNKYTPMAASPIRDQILQMAHANRIPTDNVYVFDASKQSKRISANVSGIGPTIRISLNDNLLNRAPPADIKAVMGHEMGHYVLNHPLWLVLEFSLVVLVMFAIVWWATPLILARHGARWGVTGPGDTAVIPLYVALLTLLALVATPVTNSIIRNAETQADRFGLDAAREPDGFADTAMRLSEYRKIDPSPLEETLFFDHPSGRNRVLMAMEWKARHLAELPPAQRGMVRPAPLAD